MSETEVQVEEAVIDTPEKPEVDLSAVPEKVRAHVDPDKYTSDTEYKRAIDHGWKPKDVFVEEGGDEAVWAGYKAFNSRYDGIRSTREIEKEMKELKKNTESIIRTFAEEKEIAVRQALSDYESQLKTAIEDGNAAEAAQIQRQIIEKNHELKATLPQQSVNLEPLALREIRKKNSFLNPDSPDYNAELAEEFKVYAQTRAKAYYDSYGGRGLVHDEIRIIAEEALDMVKDRAQKKAPPKAPAASKPAQGQGGHKPKLTPMQQEFYNQMVESGNKAAADRYLKSKT